MKTYTARASTRTMKRALVVPIATTTSAIALLLTHPAPLEQQLFPIIVCALTLAGSLAAYTRMRRLQGALLTLSNAHLIYADAHGQTVIDYDSVRALSASAKGTTLELITTRNKHRFSLVFEGTETLIPELTEALSARSCAINHARLDTARELARAHHTPPTLARVASSAALGTAVMWGFYKLFVASLPFIL